MSEAPDTPFDLDALTRTRQPFELEDEMTAKVKELGLEDTVRQLPGRRLRLYPQRGR